MAQAYDDLGRQPAVAVRSSAVSEDGDAASFAGQQDTFLNVRGEEAVARQVQACWASFLDRGRCSIVRKRARSRTRGWRSSSRKWSAQTRAACCSRSIPSESVAIGW